ncbi:hypothetical protein BDB01DRAFT_794468 [Pilobolus umbonatus]|nr:hypothetical protein BDB01DRAFT_794468 [Pilobolus umbonatus]
MSKKNLVDEEIECSETLEEENKSILLDLIAQLRKGTDLSRITLPTFVLEPRSLLERLSDFMSHPDILIGASKTVDPVERFVEVCRFFLSGWHVIPKGVKKPYNPVLGEFFRCEYELEGGAKAMYLSEQVSHHPPISAYYYSIPEHGIYISGETHPKAKFLGNSAATLMKGYSRITFSELYNETYEITNPNVYARGILFGKMIMEMGDQSTIRCPTSDLICELDFKTKGYFSGQYHSVVGKIKKEATDELLYELSGVWTSELFIKAKNSPIRTNFFNLHQYPVTEKKVIELEKQELNESRRLWSNVTHGLVSNDMEYATTAKTLIENTQREETGHRQKEGIQWHPRFFNVNKYEEYDFKGIEG